MSSPPQPAGAPALPSASPPAPCRSSACWDEAFAVRPLSTDLAARMRGTVWRPGCPVGLEALREVHVAHATSSTAVERGMLVVHADVAADVVAAFRELLDAGFIIERVASATLYDGDDLALMDANVTSGFNCRRITGGTSFSPHSWGIAIDINPKWNPWVRDGRVLPPSGKEWVEHRGLDRPGLLVEGSAAVDAFESRGWTWGGRWRRPRDWQHVEKRGSRPSSSSASSSSSSSSSSVR
jgi:hypothetical protein